ncbi:MAG: hypothetical protein JWM43_1357 [Acidobacteriaceae bacterium]|nr:hypothetical protein [Acidobacteriaceae bacterium]
MLPVQRWSLSHISRSRLHAFLPLLCLGACHMLLPAQEPAPDRVTELQRLVESSQTLNLSRSKQGYLYARLAAAWRERGDYFNAEAAYEKALSLFEGDATSTSNYATTLDNLGTLDLTFGRVTAAQASLKRALAMKLQLGDPADVARTEQHIAKLELAEHHFKEAEKNASHALRAALAEPGSNATDRLSALVTLAFARCSRGHCDEGMRDAQQAMELARANFPADSIPIAHAYMALGFTQWISRAPQDADRSMQKGLGIFRALMPPKDPILVLALREYREFLNGTNRSYEAAQIGLQIDQQSTFCANCSISVHSLKSTTH